MNTIGLALHGAAVTGAWLRLGAPAELKMREAVRLSEEMSLVHTRAWGLFFLGIALHRQSAGAGLHEVEAGLCQIQRNGDKRFNSLHYSLTAQVYSDIGRHRDEVSTMHRAFDALEESRDDVLAADLYRVRAKLTLAVDASSRHEAEVDLRTAIDIAHTQGALMPELRATTDLAKLLADRKETGEAADLLGAIHGSFTEGFQTPDLLDATALLAEVR